MTCTSRRACLACVDISQSGAPMAKLTSYDLAKIVGDLLTIAKSPCPSTFMQTIVECVPRRSC